MVEPSTKTDTKAPSPDGILQIARGYMSSKFLFEASEAHLFEKLGRRALSLPDIAREIGMPIRTARILVDAVAALGLVEKDGSGLYRNGPAAAAFLAGATAFDLNPALRLWNRLEYGEMERLGAALRAGDRPPEWHLPPEKQELFSTGVEAVTRGVADALPRAYDFSKHRRVIDLGGGTGSFLIPICARFPHVECTLFELPNTARVARERLSRESTPERDLSAKITVLEGDLMKDPIPTDHDAFLVSNVIHVFSPERTKHLLKSIRRSAPTRSRLLLVDFWMAEDHLTPLAGALMAGAFLLRSGEGDVYSVGQVRQWLQESGWTFREHIPLVGPQSLVVAEA